MRLVLSGQKRTGKQNGSQSLSIRSIIYTYKAGPCIIYVATKVHIK